MVWPVTLQQRLNADTFSEEIGDTVIRSNMDIGEDKVRRRYTRSVDILQGSINVDVGDYTIFKNFYKTETNGGITPFEFTHPISGELLLVRFLGPPKFDPLGGVMFRANFTWEIKS